jgi:hypothetical protein
LLVAVVGAAQPRNKDLGIPARDRASLVGDLSPSGYQVGEDRWRLTEQDQIVLSEVLWLKLEV